MGREDAAASDEIISLREVREFVKTSQSRIIPERVAELITERTFITEFSEELKELFDPLVDDLKARLVERNLDLGRGKKPRTKLSMKEQRMLKSLCILQTALADSLAKSGSGDKGEALSYARQAQESCNLAGEYHLLTAAMDMEASRMRDLGDNIGALRKQREAYRIGVEQNDPDIIQRSLYNQSATLRGLGRYAEAIEKLYEVIDSVGESDHAADRFILGLAYNQLAWALLAIEDYVGAYQATCSGLDSVDTDIPSVRVNLLITQAFVCQAREDFIRAFEAARDGLQIARKLDDQAQVASLLTALGKIQVSLGDIAEARRAYEEAIEIFDRLEFTAHREEARVALAGVLQEHGEYAEALVIYAELLSKLRRTNSQSGRSAWILSNAGDLYTLLEQFDEAEQVYREALDLHAKGQVPQGPSGILLKMGRLYSKQGKGDEAISFYERALGLLDREADRTLAIEASAKLAELYERKGNAERALVSLRTCHELSMDAKDAMLDDRLNHLRIQHQVEQHRTEVELERLRREKVEAELEKVTLALTEKSELIGSLRRKVRDILRELDGEQLPVLGSALQQIVRHVADTQQSDQSAVLLLRSVNEKFYEELKRQHPTLTPGQIKLCGFIRAGMDKQDIMAMLHISLDSLNKQRYRVRKRLGLKTGESLENYLALIG